MMLPHSARTAWPWRIHGLTRDFRPEQASGRSRGQAIQTVQVAQTVRASSSPRGADRLRLSVAAALATDPHHI